mgnify:CR=1 FL=1|jgi:hypothetical protein
MGYTHYWKHDEVIKADWRKAIEEVDKVLRRHHGVLQFEYDNDAKPEANDSSIRFNGIDEDGHETFWVSPEATGFSFCKTARKPYDLAVCEVLIILSCLCGFDVSSDGDFDDEWAEATKNVKEHHGFEFTSENLR